LIKKEVIKMKICKELFVYAIAFLLGILVAKAQINVEGKATIKQVDWQDGKVIGEKFFVKESNFAINEIDSVLTLGIEEYKIIEIQPTDSVITYLCENKPDKEYVYNLDDKLTQKNVKWRSHGLETWFIYTLISSGNEFEF